MIFLFFVQKYPKNWGKFGKFRLEIHLVIIQPKMRKNIKNHKCCGKILQIWGKFHFYIHLALHTPKLQKMSKIIKIPEICWKIPQNWEKIWKIQSLYTFSPIILQNAKNNQKSWILLENPPKLRENLGNFILISI